MPRMSEERASETAEQRRERNDKERGNNASEIYVVAMLVAKNHRRGSLPPIIV